MKAILVLSGNHYELIICVGNLNIYKNYYKIMADKILIIVPRYVSSRVKAYYEFPLGLAYISSCLKRSNYHVDVFNLNHYDGTQEDLICNNHLLSEYKYILTGGLSAHFQQIKSVVESVKKQNIETTIIVGGGIVTSMPEVMYDYLLPDYVVIGEGEITIVELMDTLFNGKRECKHVNGIGFRNASGHFVLTPPRSPVMDLDTLPWPDLSGFEIETYLAMQKPNDNLYLYINDNPRFYPMISSRGCPFNCTFCYHPLGQKYRSRSVDNFIEEVEYVTNKYKVNNLAIFDELLSSNRKRLYEICSRLKNISHPLRWMCQLRVDSVDEEMLLIMKDAGCFFISYGFESASDLVLKSMKKKINDSQIERALKLTRKAGIGIQGYFIYGDPAETKESAYETLNFWGKFKDYHITMGYVRPYPGSVLWNNEIVKGNLNSPEEQISFLHQCINDPPNICSMNAKEWFELQKDVQKAIIMNAHYGEFISSRRNGENSYAMTVRCPHCSEVVTYNNFNPRILGVFKLVCRECNQAMNMTPLAFDHVRDDYERNLNVFKTIKNNEVPVVVTPCMSPAEFQAMSEVFLKEVSVQFAMDMSDRKVEGKYLGMDVLKRTQENIVTKCKGHYFLIPLTRFAGRIFNHLLSLGVDNNHICRLDEITLDTLSELEPEAV